MEQTAFDHNSILGARLYRLTRGDLTALCEALCSILSRTDGYHGGVRPGNISYAGAGVVALGDKARAGTRDWSTEELEFMAPEVFWSGDLAPSADVYSVGLLLYAGVSGGRLPFYPQMREPTPNDRASALRRRMNGEALNMPKGAGKKLAEIIRKATQYRAEDRYQTPAELRAALQQYRAELKSAAPTAQEMFDKPEQELSDVERMMLGILGSNAAVADEPEEELEAPEPAESEAAAAEEPAPVEDPRPEPELPVSEKSAPDEESIPAEPILEPVAEEPKPEAPDPAEESVPVEEPKSEPEWKGREIHQPPKKNNHKGGIIAALAICAVVLVVLILRSLGVFGNVKPESTPTPEPTPTAEATPTPTPTPEPTPTPTPEPKVSTYEVIVADVSWEAAEADAEAKGGHLAVIDDAEEFQRVTALAAEQGVRYAWIGLYRTESGELAWVHSTESGYYNWAEGEPSVHDTNGAAENYVLLSNQNGTWYYNDCIADPAASYPRFYSGQIAYIVEYEG